MTDDTGSTLAAPATTHSRRRLLPLLLGALAMAVVAAIAVTVLGSDDGDEPVVVVDERRGVLHGITFGDGGQEVRATLGDPTDDYQGFFPEGSDYTGPPAIPAPASDQSPPREPTPLHYDDLAFLVSSSVGVYSMATLEPGARTRAGVGVGDDLTAVRGSYEPVSCGEMVAGEPIFGGEPPTYRWCRARVGDIRVFFGGDPIESITLTRLP